MSKKMVNFSKEAKKVFPNGTWEKDNTGQLLFYTNTKAKVKARKLCKEFLPEGQVETDNYGFVLIYTNHKN